MTMSKHVMFLAPLIVGSMATSDGDTFEQDAVTKAPPTPEELRNMSQLIDLNQKGQLLSLRVGALGTICFDECLPMPTRFDEFENIEFKGQWCVEDQTLRSLIAYRKRSGTTQYRLERLCRLVGDNWEWDGINQWSLHISGLALNNDALNELEELGLDVEKIEVARNYDPKEYRFVTSVERHNCETDVYVSYGDDPETELPVSIGWGHIDLPGQ